MSLITMESKAAAEQKLNRLIETGRTRAQSVIEHVMTNQPSDYLAAGSDINFAQDEDPTPATCHPATPSGDYRTRSPGSQVRRRTPSASSTFKSSPAVSFRPQAVESKQPKQHNHKQGGTNPARMILKE
jgi:hypothetical protein